MPYIPAICDRCGHTECSPVFIKDETMHCRDHLVGQCSCGGRLLLLDGTYTHLGGPINFCNAPPEKIEQFRQAKQELHIP